VIDNIDIVAVGNKYNDDDDDVSIITAVQSNNYSVM